MDFLFHVPFFCTAAAGVAVTEILTFHVIIEFRERVRQLSSGVSKSLFVCFHASRRDA
jgi:hypothetical protein